MKVVHLTKRFFGSLWPFGPRQRNTQWAESLLSANELLLWRQMSRADRRHAVGVARRVHKRDPDFGDDVLVAALLHDVGKTASGLGTYGRVVATLSGIAGGYEMADAWSQAEGFTRRVGLYLRHGELGAEMLALAGGSDIAVAWAREHHLPEEEWTVDPTVANALKEADDD